MNWLKIIGRRKQYIINPGFQWRFIGFIAILTVVNAAVIFLANFLFFNEFEAKGKALGLPPDHVFFQFLSHQETTLNIISAITAVVLLIIMGFSGMYLSNKVAGPLYRLNIHMRGIAGGATPKHVFFRKGDFFPELSEGYNMQLDCLLETDAKATPPPENSEKKSTPHLKVSN